MHRVLELHQSSSSAADAGIAVNKDVVDAIAMTVAAVANTRN
jgi:hypothetical protein